MGADAHEYVLELVGALVEVPGCVGETAVVLLAFGIGRRFVEFAQDGGDSVLYGPEGRFGIFHRRNSSTKGVAGSRRLRIVSVPDVWVGAERHVAAFFWILGNISKHRRV